MPEEGRKRVAIEKVWPELDCGRFRIHRVTGERVVVRADVFADGHERVAAALLYRSVRERSFHELPMEHAGNDRWEAEFRVEELGAYLYTVEGWLDPFASWQEDLQKRLLAGQEVDLQLLMGAALLRQAAGRAAGEERGRLERLAERLESKPQQEGIVAEALAEHTAELARSHRDRSLAVRYERELEVQVERRKAGFSAWYEFFPRSASPQEGRYGSLADAERLLPDISAMGFDVVYLPPIHPIGHTGRKGRNNAMRASPGDPGSPWAIGSEEGGHKAVDPQLGTLEDLRSFAIRCRENGLELALDIALQCSPDHPYVKEHPEWFRWRPDGTVQFAENPPKKYEDILPINFETQAWQELWQELKSVFLFWIEQGVRMFRVDNPHTKPFAFWRWLIAEVKAVCPEAIFLAEAFTRPKVMYRLAKVGFTQSYTYFTWRHTKQELSSYVTELTGGEAREFFQPCFWPNTPDILPDHLQFGGRAAFVIRLVLAATLSSCYGIYGPPFELCVNRALAGGEEYADSEKYELRSWDRNREGNIKDMIRQINRIRRDNQALHSTWNLRLCRIENDSLLAYIKADEELSNVVLVVVNLDPYQPQAGVLHLPLEELRIRTDRPFLAQELLSGNRHIWQGVTRTINLDPEVSPAAIYRLHPRLRREQDYDYFM
jgi:starch synthase (maltosyl-transferring)